MIRNNSTIPWWAWGTMSIVSASTLTNVGSVAAIIMAIIMLAGLARYQWVKTHPFTIVKSRDNRNFRPINWVKRVDLYLGNNTIALGVLPREATSWDTVSVRFENRKFSLHFNRLWEYKDADPQVIRVTELEDFIFREKGEEWGRSYFESEGDGMSGFHGIYSSSLPVKRSEDVWFYVYAEAQDEWQGFLTFKGVLQNQLLCARIKTRVYMEQLIREDGKVKKLTKKQFHKLLDKASKPIKKSDKEKS